MFEITTIYLNPTDRIGYTGSTSNLLSNEATKWLEDNVGSRAPTYRDLVIDMPHDNYHWSFNGRVYIPDTNYTKIGYAVSFRDGAKAVMFKLAWND